MNDPATATAATTEPQKPITFNPEAEAAFNECMALLDQLMARLNTVPMGVDANGKPRPQIYFVGFLGVESADGGACKGGGVTHARGDQVATAVGRITKDMPFPVRMAAMMGDPSKD